MTKSFYLPDWIGAAAATAGFLVSIASAYVSFEAINRADRALNMQSAEHRVSDYRDVINEIDSYRAKFSLEAADPQIVEDLSRVDRRAISSREEAIILLFEYIKNRNPLVYNKFDFENLFDNFDKKRCFNWGEILPSDGDTNDSWKLSMSQMIDQRLQTQCRYEIGKTVSGTIKLICV